MVIEYWLLGGLVAAGLLVIGYLAGRLTAPGDRHNEALRDERDAARQELNAMRDQVNDHFGESARLFGNLAQDYRALYEHFAHSARDLGLPETERREMLESATGPITTEAPLGDAVNDTDEANDEPAGDSATDHHGTEQTPADGEDTTGERDTDTPRGDQSPEEPPRER